MSKIIYINFINIDSQNFFNPINNKVLINIYDDVGISVYTNEYNIKYNNITNSTIKKYQIEIYEPFIFVDSLNTNNFKLELKLFKYEYGYYKDDLTKSLIIFNIDNFYQLIYLGLPNQIVPPNIIINYDYFKIETEYNSILPFYQDSQSIMMLNNYQGISNYLQNTILLNGPIYNIDVLSIADYEITNNNYKLFKINPSINLDLDTHIYFYNDKKNFPYILYLNTYNFSEYKLFPENYETIILMIDYIILPEEIYYKNTNVNKYFYKKNSDGNEEIIDYEPSEEIVYSIVLSLSLQTFNSNSLENPDLNSNPNYNYNVLFFENYTDENYFVNSIRLFNYDYLKYFNTNTELYNIINYSTDLYQIIIANDNSLENPTIPEINYWYLQVNFNLINLSTGIIRFNCESNNFHNFMKSDKISVDTLVNYLLNFELKPCNIYQIINNKIELNNEQDIKNNHGCNYNYNYLYSSTKHLNKKYTNKGIVNLSNNILNCIRCKIVFLFNQFGCYSFYGKIFLDNYNIQIYHKNYDIDDLEKKKKLLNLLLYIGTTSLGVKIIFYNQIDSEPKVSSFFNYYLNTNPYYLFNEINLSKKLDNYLMYFNIDSTNTNYNQQYLKLNLEIKLDYYILFLYSDKNSVLKDYSELVFSYSQYIFKIFKIAETNGNIYGDKDVFYIGFNNLNQLNLFMEYLNSGTFNTNIQKLSNYFNIPKSVIFCNYYLINNYWVLDSLPGPQITDPNVTLKHKIYFSIGNLHVNQIYLQGNLNIKEIL